MFPFPGKITCSPNQTARFRITPTTAAVTVDSAAVSNYSGFTEKDSFAKNRVIGSEKNSGKRQRQRPDHNPSRRNLERVKPCWFRAPSEIARKIAIQRMRDFAAKIFG